jgi:hypothetical protein
MLRKAEFLRLLVAEALAISLLILPWALTTVADSNNLVDAGRMIRWNLSHGKVVHRGRTARTCRGTLTTEYVVEATACALGDAPIENGKFRMTLTAFSPSRGISNKVSGRWHIHGDWTITAEGTRSRTAIARRRPVVLKGDLRTHLPFNPTTSHGSIKASISLPRSKTCKKCGKGEGVFYGNDRFEGHMFVMLESWQDGDRGEGFSLIPPLNVCSNEMVINADE